MTTLDDLLRVAGTLGDGFTISMLARELGVSETVVRLLVDKATRLDRIEEFGRQHGRRYRLVTEVSRTARRSVFVEELAATLGGRPLYYIRTRGIFLTIEEALRLTARLKS